MGGVIEPIDGSLGDGGWFGERVLDPTGAGGVVITRPIEAESGIGGRRWLVVGLDGVRVIGAAGGELGPG